MSTSYDNPEHRDKLDEARQKIAEYEREDKAQTGAASKEARDIIAAEEQPGLSLPEPEVKTVEWRDTPLEFDEMGSALVDIVVMEEKGENAKMMEYVTEMLADKCRHPAADREYWRRFDLMPGDDDSPDSLMDLFKRLTGGDLSPEQKKKVEEFRAGK